jgi:hydrogenase maturation factor
MTGAGASGVDCAGGHCVTCADEAVAMTVVLVDRERVLALCEGPDGARTSVETELVGPVLGGDRVLVHAGVAIAMLDEGAETRVLGR